MANSDVFSVSEHFVAEHGVTSFIRKRLEFRDSLSETIFELDGQLLPRLGELTCIAVPDETQLEGYTWEWAIEPEKPGRAFEIVSDARRYVDSVEILDRSKVRGDYYARIPFDATPGRVTFLIADLGKRWTPNFCGFVPGFAAAGIPILTMHGFNLGPTWGILRVSCDEAAPFGPELVFQWDDLSETITDDNLPGPPYNGDYAGEIAMRACYDQAEKRNGRRGIPYAFTPNGIETRIR